MAAKRGSDGGDLRARDGADEGSWHVDWDAVPMARLLDEEPPAEPVREQHQPSPDTVSAARPEAPAPPRARERPPARASSPTKPPVDDAPAPAPRARTRLRRHERPAAAERETAPAPPLPPVLEGSGIQRRRGTSALRSEPAPLPADAGRSQPRRPRISRGIVIGVLVVSVAAGGTGRYMLTRPDPGAPSAAPAASSPVQGSAIAPFAAPGDARDNRRAYSRGEAFVASGVRFTVVPDTTARWARRLASSEADAGRSWRFVSVLYRNLSRPQFVAEDLRLRVKDADGDVYEPDAGFGNGGSDLAPGSQISPGTLVKGRLAFQVPSEARELALIIDLAPDTRARVDFAPG